MNIHLKYWRFGGIWPLPNDGIFYKLYMFAVQLCASVIFNGCVLASLWEKHSFDDLLKCLMPGITTVLTSVKMYILLRNQSKIFQMFDNMQQLDDFFETTNYRKKLIDDKIVDEALKRSRQLLAFLSATSYSAITLAFLIAIISPEKLFMWPTALPFDVETDDRVYYAALIVQFVLNLFIGCIFTSLDIYGPVLVIVLSVYLDRLGLKLQDIGGDVDNKGSVNELKECVECHIRCFK